MEAHTSLRQLQADLKNNVTTSVGVVTSFLAKIEEQKHLNAFLEVYAVEALAQAAEVDAKIKAGTAGRLAGLVVGLKDVLCLKGHGLQSSSRILDGFVSQFNGTAVERLLAEDAIVIGRQNCDEFAMGSSNENSAFGPVLNAADNSRVPGGSSGGSAVAVQAGLCHISLGSDTGGSVRQPAAFCGVLGMKPTYSRISRHGLIAFASSFDQIGIFGTKAEDVGTVLEVIAGKDDYDSTVSHQPVDSYGDLQAMGDRKLRIAYIRDCVEHDAIQPAMREANMNVLERLRKEGHAVEPVDFPLLDYCLPVYYILSTAEASSNLARFDGVKYGFRSPNVSDLESLYKKTRGEGFGAEVKRRIMLGTFVLSASYYDAYFTKAQRVRRIIKEQTEAMLQEYDLVLNPTTPTTAFELGARTSDPIQMYLADLFTVQASVAGMPALSIPIGKDADGLPIGLQAMGRAWDEKLLLSFAKHLSSN